MDSVSSARLALVYPRLAAKITQMADMLASEFPIKVSMALRTWAEQDKLWQQGRNPDGSYIDPIHHKGVVTNARGGHSYHCFGLAVDCEPVEKDGSIDWDASHPQWKRMESVGTSLGLVSGADWVRLVDAPHFQLTGRFPEGAPDDEIRELAVSSVGLSAVWDAVSASLGVTEGEWV